MVTGSGSSRPRHLRHEKSPESGSCGCGVNGGGSILPRSSFPQLKFLYCSGNDGGCRGVVVAVIVRFGPGEPVVSRVGVVDLHVGNMKG
ncbi:hypothetical protein Bca101_029660 [Brassica carinata]